MADIKHMRRRPNWQALADIASSEITDQALFKQRRAIIKASVAAGIGGAILAPAAHAAVGDDPLPGPIAPSDYSTDEEQTTFDTATSYNNFSELGLDKEDPKCNADRLVTDPWSVVVEGECNKPGTLNLEDVLRPHPVEERIYRLRCVEAWSMVIPWNGFALGDLLKRFEPGSKAKYVAFETLNDPELPGMRSSALDWPYQEGLRIDEAMHPLAMIAIGMYGESIPNQNGAPLRLVVPWKYGFKSIKSIVRIRFTEEQPPTTWNQSAPHEYGFYSNVNPDVSHPRWSQARERRLAGDTGALAALFQSKIDSRFMNGYADEVASLYSDLDLTRHF